MSKQEKIKYYWNRINNIEKKISDLSDKGLSYSKETNKRKLLIAEVRRLERK